MLGSLRFRLTAVFLAVVLVFGLVSIGLAVRLFQDVTRQQSVDELRREASGLAALYAESAIRSSDEGAKAPEFAAEKLELATGDELYYIGASLFPGQRFGLTRLPRSALGDVELERDEQIVVEFTPPGESRRLLAVAQPVQLVQGTEPFGWLIVAKPEAELREQWVYAARPARARARSRRRPRRSPVPVAVAAPDRARARAHARDRAGRGRSLRRRDSGAARPRRDRPAERALPRHGREARRGGAAQALVPHVGLARAPDAADGDPGARRGDPRGHRQRAGAGSRLARHRRGGDRPARAARRRRARPRQAPGPSLHGAPRGGRPRAPARPGVRCVHRGGAASRDRLLALGRGGRARHRVRRRSRAAGDHEPPLERLSVDAGRRAHRAAARRGERRRLGRRRRLRPGRAAVAAHERSSRRSSRRTPRARASGFRSPASSRSRSAAGSSSARMPARGSRFRLVLPVVAGARRRALAVRPRRRAASSRSAVCVCERLDRPARSASRRGALEAREARVDTAPARADEVDEEREVVDTRVPLGEEVALDPLEAADRLVQEAADLGDVPRDREAPRRGRRRGRRRRRAPGSTPRARRR